MNQSSMLKKLMAWFELNGNEGIVVAFSGGLDSTLVAAVASNVLGDRAISITVKNELITQKEAEYAAKQAECIGIKHRVLELELPEGLKENPLDRCYRCKKFILGRLKDFAAKNGFQLVIDGTNFDDLKTDRPGLRALEEEQVRSPLAELGIGKVTIRELSKEMGLDNTKQPSPCLATRFQFGHTITKEELHAVAEAEEFIRGLGFRQVRVRVFDETAKIEVEPSDVPKVFEGGKHLRIVERLKELGFKHIMINLEGYKVK